ncbi:MAG: hypothetical protein SGI96_21235 [Bacteroidota bacterium]|nr:hypothetical protein [Bacteroidota bacterium]
MSDIKSESTELVRDELNNNLMALLPEEQIKFVQNVAAKFMPINIDGNGKQFWKDVILSSTKDYPTDSTAYYQVIREGKGRVSRLLDEAIAHQELLLDVEELEVQINCLNESLLEMVVGSSQEKLKTIEIRRAELKLKQKKIRIEFSKNSVASTLDEIKDFDALAEDYKKSDIKEFKEARVEEMQKKKVDRYLHFILTGTALSNPEWAYYYKDGFVVPPVEVIQRLKDIGHFELANQEQNKLTTYQNWKSGIKVQPIKQLPLNDDLGIKIVSKEEAMKQ